MICLKCGAETGNENAKFCENCGKSFVKASKEPSVVYITLTSVFSAMFLLLYFVFFSPSLISLCSYNAFIIFFTFAIGFPVYVILLMLLARMGKFWPVSIIFGALFSLLFAIYWVGPYIQMCISAGEFFKGSYIFYTFTFASASVVLFGDLIMTALVILFVRPKKSGTGNSREQSSRATV